MIGAESIYTGSNGSVRSASKLVSKAFMVIANIEYWPIIMVNSTKP